MRKILNLVLFISPINSSYTQNTEMSGDSFISILGCFKSWNFQHKINDHVCLIGDFNSYTGTGGFSPHKGPVMRKMFPFDDVIMYNGSSTVDYFIMYNTVLNHVQTFQSWRI